ncbi:hypothetical protein QMO14_21510 [Variovorax sp. CAN2819]|uniref:hypothetical protein n=1 Tax=Variovorax sp. CAN15 TaxID=3046727 RepID=UPI00264825DE|nr:hypothetical protein [Variovorax sp. CAN15]MDN6886172.1 hypothetical protein [Variovorax sp. CAN15]
MTALGSIKLRITGMGVIFYSPFATEKIQEGEDYLSSNFENPDLVEAEALRGGIVGINLGTPGDFILNIYAGYPNEDHVTKSAYKLRAGIEVKDEIICVRDLFDLMNWSRNISERQIISLENGFYHMTFLSDEPSSGILGDDQIISLYLQRLEEMPKLKFNGIPTLC